MTPTTFLSTPTTDLPVSEWLQRLIHSFHSGHRALPLRANRLLEQLHAEAEIVAGATRRLHHGMRNSSCLQVLPELEQCLEAVRQMDRELTSSICRTLVTPIDSEDLRLLSAHSVRLVRQQTRIARMLAAEGHGGLSEVQQPVAEWAEAFSRAIAGLPCKGARDEAEAMRSLVRATLYLLRDRRCRLLAGNLEVRSLMRDLARLDVYEEVVEHMKLVHTDILTILLKQ